MAQKNPTLSAFASESRTFIGFIEEELPAIKAAYQARHGRPASTLSFGYTSHPLPSVAAEAMAEYALGLSRPETYSSYEPVTGNPELKRALAEDYRLQSDVTLDPDELFITNGAQLACIITQELFAATGSVALPDPCYPAFIEGTQLYGKRHQWLRNDPDAPFTPLPPEDSVDVLYLCSPSNPTGVVASERHLRAFVDYARERRAVILFDAAYRSFVTTPGAPRSIYEIEGAEECAIEIGSFSKDVGFAGLRVGWCVVPKQLQVSDSRAGELHEMWRRQRQVKLWGPSNIAQRGALAALSPEGRRARRRAVDYYLGNTRRLRGALEHLGVRCYGGDDNPYVWAQSPVPQTDRAFMGQLLEHTGLVGAPGSIFGPAGAGHLRLSGLGAREEITEIAERLERLPPLVDAG